MTHQAAPISEPLSPFHVHFAAELERLKAAAGPRIQGIRERWQAKFPDSPTLPERLKTLNARGESTFTPERLAKGQAALATFPFHPSDVFIATAARSGTTLTQQLVHQLRTGGHMDFRSIDDVAPWLDLHLLLELPLPPIGLNAFSPRAFKTHLGFDKLLPPTVEATGMQTPPAKYLHIVRAPQDMLLSLYEFVVGWQFSSDELSRDEFIRDFLYSMPIPAWILSLLSFKWASESFPAHILWIFYEDLVTYRAEAVRRVGQFLELDACADFEQRVAVATERTSIGFMKMHGTQFEDPEVNRALSAAAGIAPRSSAKVNRGEVGRGRRQLSDERLTELKEVLGIWLEEGFGVSNYEELRAQLYTSKQVQVFRPGE